MVNWSNVLLVLPFQDYPTASSSEVLLQTKKYAEKKGFDVSTLFGSTVSRFAMDKLIDIVDPGVVFYGGHGEADAWVYGSVELKSLLDEKNAHLMKGRIVVANPVCNSLQRLGPYVVREGALAYIGSKDVVWVMPDLEEHKYREDFMDTWLNLNFDILDGLDVDTAVSNYRIRINNFLREYQEKGYKDYKKPLMEYGNRTISIYDAFIWNRDIIGYIGDGRAKIGVEPKGRNIVNYGWLGKLFVLSGLSFLGIITYDIFKNNRKRRSLNGISDIQTRRIHV